MMCEYLISRCFREYCTRFKLLKIYIKINLQRRSIIMEKINFWKTHPVITKMQVFLMIMFECAWSLPTGWIRIYSIFMSICRLFLLLHSVFNVHLLDGKVQVSVSILSISMKNLLWRSMSKYLFLQLCTIFFYNVCLRFEILSNYL